MKTSSFTRAAALLALSLIALPAAAEPAFFARAPVSAWHGARFNIVRIAELNRFDAERAMIENAVSTFPDDVEALQATIRANRPLASALRARGVQIGNVVAIQQAFSGGLVFYLR